MIDFFFCLSLSLQRKTTAVLKTKHIACSSKPFLIFPEVDDDDDDDDDADDDDDDVDDDDDDDGSEDDDDGANDDDDEKNVTQEVWDVEPFNATVVQEVARGKIDWLEWVW